MGLRKDLEDRITSKLVSLSNEDAQRIAEDFVRIRYPERFPYFGFRAFSPEGKSRSGWPDASSIGPDGKIEGVEATLTASRAGVARHLEEYLQRAKVLKPGQIAGFLHISVSPKASFLPDEIKEWTDKFVEAGFARGRVELVFGQGLVEILAGPEFSRTRVEILGIHDLPTHFRLYRSKIGPDERRLGVSFIPNWEDFEKRRVYRPEAAEAVAERLDRERVALVRGIGASGKTVLAWLLAQDVLQRGLPAYAFDFADQLDVAPSIINALIDDLKRFGHRDALFVLDNIHLEETSTKELFLAWEEIPVAQRPRLLLVGRETRTAKGSTVASLKLDPLLLRARQAELRGVFRRLALREQDWLPEPPEAELTNWLRTFGGNPDRAETTADLIAFSAAVTQKMRDLCRGRWQLMQKDALEQVREVYLRKLSVPEQQNLLRLCIAEEFELGVPAEALSDQKAGLTTCNSRLGIVFRDESGVDKQRVRYRLVHAAFGELMLSAMQSCVDRAGILREMTLAAPYLGYWTAVRLVRLGRLDDAKTLLAELVTEPDTLLLMDTLDQIEGVLRLAKQLAIEPPECFDDALASKDRIPRLAEIALKTPLAILATFLRYAGQAFPRVFMALPIELAIEKNRSRLTANALDTSLSDLAAFLRYAERALPRVHDALTTELETEKNHPALIEIAHRAPLHFLASFLGYAEKAMPAVFAVLSAELAIEKNRSRLTENALETPLGHLVAFLRYAERALPRVHDALTAELEAGKNHPALIESAQSAPLSDLASFVGYVEKSLPSLYSGLNGYFSSRPGRKMLAAKIRDAAEHEIVSVLTDDSNTDFWLDALLEVDLEEWKISRKNGPLPKIDAFVKFQKVVSSIGKSELANSPADRIVTDTSQSDWNQPGIGQHHLSHVLRLATEATEDQKLAFVMRVATPDWLDPRYQSAPAGGLAGALFALFKSLPLESYGHFDRPVLRERISKDLRAAREPKSRARALSLWGAASLLGVTCDTAGVIWPDADELAEILLLQAPSPESEAIRVMESQLWLGVRLMAAELERPLPVPAEHGNRILELWQVAQDRREIEKLPPKLVEINTAMIAWLQSCKSGGWRLLPPRRGT